MNIGEYLCNNFPGGIAEYKEFSQDGIIKGYYVKGNNADEMYLPADISGDVGMLSYVPGSGSALYDAVQLRERMEKNPPKYPITIAGYDSNLHHCIEVGYKLAKGANMNVVKNITVSFSSSGFISICETNQFEINHPEVQSIIISCEPYDNQSIERIYGNENRDALKNSNSKIIFVFPRNELYSRLHEIIKSYAYDNIPCFFLGTQYNIEDRRMIHIYSNSNILTCGIIDYLLGFRGDINMDPGYGMYYPDYLFARYNIEKDEFEFIGYDSLLY